MSELYPWATELLVGPALYVVNPENRLYWLLLLSSALIAYVLLLL
ncbi:MAG: hypothetical protein ACI9JM_000154 [Halioglobus sp.]|jgi:hypothetical protein